MCLFHLKIPSLPPTCIVQRKYDVIRLHLHAGNTQTTLTTLRILLTMQFLYRTVHKCGKVIQGVTGECTRGGETRRGLGRMRGRGDQGLTSIKYSKLHVTQCQLIPVSFLLQYPLLLFQIRYYSTFQICQFCKATNVPPSSLHFSLLDAHEICKEIN